MTKRSYIRLSSQFQERNRKSTDVCCTILSAIFALVMFIVACTMWNKSNHAFNLGNFENNFFNFNKNGKGVQCKDGEFVYSSKADTFNVPTIIIFRSGTCVATCPKGYFGSQGLCLPENDELRAQYLSNPNLSGPFDYSNFKQTLIWSALTALGLGLLWTLISFCFQTRPIIAHVLGALVLITLGILVLVLWDRYYINLSSFWSNNTGLKIFFAVLCFLLAIILIAMLCWWNNERKFQGLMLDYGKRFLSERPISFFYIPVFILFAIGLIALIVWQHCCFSSVFASNNNFFNFNNSGFWEILNILELIWGLRFLRDACTLYSM